MELIIYRRGKAAGTLRIEDDGLYRNLYGRIAPSREILRLYLGGERFGVFIPDASGLILRRRVSRASLPELPARACAWCDSDGLWSPEGDGLVRYTPTGIERAIRWQTRAPMAFPAAPETLRAIRLNDAYYLCGVFPHQ